MGTKDLIQILSQVRTLSPETTYDYTMFFEKPDSLPQSQIDFIRKDLGDAVDELKQLKPSFAEQLQSALRQNPDSGLLAKRIYEEAIRDHFKSHFKKRILDELTRKPFSTSHTSFEFPYFKITGWSGLEVVVEPRRYTRSVTDPVSIPNVEVKATLELKNLEIDTVRETDPDSHYINKIVTAENWSASIDSKISAAYYFDLNSNEVKRFKFYKDPEIKLSFGRQRSTEQREGDFFAGRPLPTLIGLAGFLAGIVLPVMYLFDKKSADGFYATPIGAALCVAWHVLNKKYRKQDKIRIRPLVSNEHYERRIPL